MPTKQWIAPQELTIFEVGPLWQAYQADPPRDSEFNLDLAHVATLDSAGAQLLLYLVHHSKQQGCLPRIVALPDSIRSILNQLGLQKSLGLEEPV